MTLICDGMMILVQSLSLLQEKLLFIPYRQKKRLHMRNAKAIFKQTESSINQVL